MKRNFYKLYYLSIISFVFLTIPQKGFGGQSFTPLEPLSGKTVGVGGAADLDSYLNTLFDLGLALAAVLAVVMLVAGGFRYMVSDVLDNKSAAREQMKNAIVGLILALSVVLILQTINPNIVTLDLNLRNDGIRSIEGNVNQGDLSTIAQQGAENLNQSISQPAEQNSNGFQFNDNSSLFGGGLTGESVSLDRNPSLFTDSAFNDRFNNFASNLDSVGIPFQTAQFDSNNSFLPNGTSIDIPPDVQNSGAISIHITPENNINVGDVGTTFENSADATIGNAATVSNLDVVDLGPANYLLYLPPAE